MRLSRFELRTLVCYDRVLGQIAVPSDLEVNTFGRSDLYIIDRGIAISLETSGRLNDVGKTILEFNLFENYREELTRTIEMKLPFNYSKTPSFLKALARKWLSKNNKHPDYINYPQYGEFLVSDIANYFEKIGYPLEYFSLVSKPNIKTPLFVTHDVDTSWILRNKLQFKKLLDLEDRLEIRGTWFCVPETITKKSDRESLMYLKSLGHEVACHGFNHDAKLPFVSAKELDRRLKIMKSFCVEYDVIGFRSEWFYRNQQIQKIISSLFKYDSSIPSFSTSLVSKTNSGSSSCHCYNFQGEFLEIPVTLPSDETRFQKKISAKEYFDEMFELCKKIATKNGVLNIVIHPQQHQVFRDDFLDEFEAFIKTLKTEIDLEIIPIAKSGFIE